MSAPRPGPDELPAYVTTPLLTLITQRSLDEDYAEAARRAQAAAGGTATAPTSRHAGLRWGTLVAVAAFALMATVVGLQEQRDAEVDELNRAALIEQAERRSERLSELQSTVRTLREDNRSLISTNTALAAQEDDERSRGNRLAMSTGHLGVRGEGVRIVVDNREGVAENDEIRDEDLATLVDALWTAGAEAIAINGERLTAMSGIRNTGRSIHVGGRPVNPPYVVEAIGDRDTLQANLVASAQGQRWFALVNQLGFDYAAQNEADLRLPAATLVGLARAEPRPEPSTTKMEGEGAS